MAAPSNGDRTAVNSGKRNDLHFLPRNTGRRESAFFASRWSSGVEGSLFRADPSPRLGFGIFNGRRPVRESQRGNGAERRPFPVSSTAPHYRRTKSKSQDFLK